MNYFSFVDLGRLVDPNCNECGAEGLRAAESLARAETMRRYIRDNKLSVEPPTKSWLPSFFTSPMQRLDDEVSIMKRTLVVQGKLSDYESTSKIGEIIDDLGHQSNNERLARVSGRATKQLH